MTTLRIVGKKPISWFFDTLHRCGWRQTLAIIWSVVADLWFDFCYGTDTVSRIPRDQIETNSDNKKYATGSGSTKVTAFLGLMRRLQLPLDGAFVDLGSGKGRIVMLAAKLGFRRIVGIDFSGTLCVIARRNLQIFLRKCPSKSQIEVLESDVTQYQFQDDETVFFMYDPFTPPVVNQMIQNLRSSAERKPRTIWLIYHVPQQEETIDRTGFFTQKHRHLVYGAEFRVYSHVPTNAV